MAVDLAPTWRSSFRHHFNNAVDFFLPPVCASCGRVGALLCAECHAALSWVRPPLCVRCGRSLPQAGAACALCLQRPLPLEEVRAALHYTGPLPPAIHALKYEGFFAVAAPLAQLMEMVWPRWRSPIDLLVPVPLHPDREKERGYNQSRLLARHLEQQARVPLAVTGLRRIRHTRPQVGLNRAERMDNVTGAFGAVRERVNGRRVLLVDDVYTTGATLAAAATALLDAGAVTVSAYCLARSVEQ